MCWLNSVFVTIVSAVAALLLGTDVLFPKRIEFNSKGQLGLGGKLIGCIVAAAAIYLCFLAFEQGMSHIWVCQYIGRGSYLFGWAQMAGSVFAAFSCLSLIVILLRQIIFSDSNHH